MFSSQRVTAIANSVRTCDAVWRNISFAQVSEFFSMRRHFCPFKNCVRFVLDEPGGGGRLDTVEEVSEPASSEYWQLESLDSNVNKGDLAPLAASGAGGGGKEGPNGGSLNSLVLDSLPPDPESTHQVRMNQLRSGAPNEKTTPQFCGFFLHLPINIT